MSARPGPILRPDPWSGALAAVVLMLAVVVGVFAIIIDAGALRAIGDVHARLGGDETVVVWAHGLESADAAQARAAEILRHEPFVRGVDPLDPSPGDGLAAAAVGAPAAGAADVRLLAVSLKTPGPGASAQIVATLHSQALPGAAVSHSWRGAARLTGAGLRLVAALAAPFAALVLVAFVAAFEARRLVRANHDAVALLRLAGAFETDIARLVRARVAALVLGAVLWGLAGALALAALAARAGLGATFGGLERIDLLSPWPLFLALAWLVGALTAGSAAKRRLRVRPPS